MAEILSPDELFGDAFTCPVCEAEGYGTYCEECGTDLDDFYFDPPEPDDEVWDGPMA